MDKNQELGGGEVHEVYQDKVENGDHRDNQASYHSPQKLDVRCFQLRTLSTELTSPQRYISFITSIAFDATLQASWEAVAVSFQAGLINGGPVWNNESRKVAWRKSNG